MYRFTILLLFLIITNASAQNGRYLQQVNLTLKENMPFFSGVYSLPQLTIEAIRTGKIKAYDIDYAKNTITPLDRAAFKSRLVMGISDYDFGDSDTIFFLPHDFNSVEIDVTKKIDKIEKVNYLHFKVADPNDGDQHKFSVSFGELSEYLNQKKALWIRNSSPWIWKGQIVHSNGYFAGDIIYTEFPDTDYRYIHLLKGSNGVYEKLQVYNTEHMLVHEQPFQGNSAEAKIQLMTSAIVEGNYVVHQEERLNTEVEEVSTPVRFIKLDKNFSLLQNEEIHLRHPANANFYIEEKELPTLIMKAIEGGKITRIYRDNSITDQMTKEEWEHNMSEEVMYASDDSENASGNAGEGDLVSARIMYTGRSATIVSVSWKKYFNDKGEVIAQMPHSIGLFIDPEQTPDGFSKLLGYFSFNDVYHALKNAREAYYTTPESGNFIYDLMKRNYFSYFTSTSGIIMQSK